MLDPEEAYLPDVLPVLDFSNDHLFIGQTECNALKVQTRAWIVGVWEVEIFLAVPVIPSQRDGVESINKRPLFANMVKKAFYQPMWVESAIGNREMNFVHACFSLGCTLRKLLADCGIRRPF